ncbi:hypothetical protein [Nocardia rhamnosiphila]
MVRVIGGSASSRRACRRAFFSRGCLPAAEKWLRHVIELPASAFDREERAQVFDSIGFLRRLPIAGAVVSGVAMVTVSAAAGAGVAQAEPPGWANCSSVAVGSRVDVECVNTDVGPATAGMAGLCTDLRILYRGEERMRPESTVRWSEECGPGAHPILWNAWAETDYHASLDDD